MLYIAALPQNSLYKSPPFLCVGIQPDYPKIAEVCNIWRNYGDIQDSWSSVASIVEFYGQDHTNFSQVAGPGHFNDPDMVRMVGWRDAVIQQFGFEFPRSAC